MIKKFMSILLVIGCLSSFSTVAYAEEIQSGNTTLLEDNASNSNNVEPRELYQYFWRVASKSKDGSGFDNWRLGPSGRGPATLNIKEASNLNIEYTTTISGDYTMGKANIGAAIGIKIGESKSYGTSYSIPIAAGEEKTIIYRPKYIKYKIDTEYVRVSNTTGEEKVLDKEESYVKVFSSWDYNWEYGKLTDTSQITK